LLHLTDNLTNTKSLLALFEVYDERKSVSIVSLRIQRLSLLIVTAAAACCCCLRHQLQPMPTSVNKCSRNNNNNNNNNKAPSALLALYQQQFRLIICPWTLTVSVAAHHPYLL